MDLGLAGKNVVITGGSKGIGFACAAAFAVEGARVAIVSRSQANLDAALKALPGAIGHAADLCDASSAGEMISQMERRLGAIDILVNSAGAALRKAPDDLTPEAYRAAMDAKYFSYVNAIDPAIKLMAARGRGVVVNIIGAGGKLASPVHVAGGAANAALMLVTAGLGAAYAPRGVRVVGVNPGITETERVSEGFEADVKMGASSPEDARRRLVERIPLGRLARPEEIANAVVFLASDRASYVTAATLNMDGAMIPSVV